MNLPAAIRLALVLALVAPVHAGTPAVRPPGWPTHSLAEMVSFLTEAEGAVFDFGDAKSIVIVKDPAWLAAVLEVLRTTEGRPDAYCFCITRPIIQLIAKDRPVASIQLTHGHKVRISGEVFSGDFIVRPADYEALRGLLRTALPARVTWPKPPPPHKRPLPARVPVQP